MLIQLFAFPLAFAIAAGLCHLLLVKAAKGYVGRAGASALRTPYRWE